jgi:hypothetical protein
MRSAFLIWRWGCSTDGSSNAPMVSPMWPPSPDAASKVSGVPQSPQKPRTMKFELWNSLRWPRVQVSAEVGKLA